MPATMPVLNEADVQAHCENGVLFVRYAGTLTANTNAKTAAWVDALQDVMTGESLRGIVYDFRSVVRFRRDNLYTAHYEYSPSSHATVHEIPTAFVVSNYYQQQMVDVMLLMTTEPGHKTVVYSIDEALDFIWSWQR